MLTPRNLRAERDLRAADTADDFPVIATAPAAFPRFGREMITDDVSAQASDNQPGDPKGHGFSKIHTA